MSLLGKVIDFALGIVAAPAEAAKASVPEALAPTAQVQTYADAIKGGKASQVAVSSFKAFEREYGHLSRPEDRPDRDTKGNLIGVSTTLVDNAPPQRGTIHADGVGYTEDYSADTLATPRDIP